MKEEKYIKDKLSNYDSPMDMDAIWADLEKNLDNQNDEKPIFWLLKYGRKLFLLGLAMLLSSLVAYSYFSNNKLSKTTSSESYKKSEPQPVKNIKSELTESTLKSEPIKNKKENELVPAKTLTQANTDLDKLVRKSEKLITLSSARKEYDTKKYSLSNKQKADKKKTADSKSNQEVSSNITNEKKVPSSEMMAEPMLKKSEDKSNKLKSIPAKNLLNSQLPLIPLAYNKLIEYSRNIPVLLQKENNTKTRKPNIKAKPGKWRASINLAATRSFLNHRNSENSSSRDSASSIQRRKSQEYMIQKM